MTSTTTGLPDRYRPLDQLAPDEPTRTGVIRSWRARDRVLNRDVALRVHTPGGPAAREWITRALTAGGLSTPALSMVYDAAEGTADDAPAAYVVNEWIEGRTLADRLTDGPLPERESRTVVRRLAEGVAEAHRVGLAVGGLTPEHVVLRPGGAVGLLAVPAASGTIAGDIAALGALLELCLTGRRGDLPGSPAPVIAQPDLAALVRRARSTEPGTALASVAAMAALLTEEPRAGLTQPIEPIRPDESESGWLRRLRDRRDLEDAEAARTGTIGAGAAGAGGAGAGGVGAGGVAGAGLPPVPPGRSADDDLDWDDAFPAEGTVDPDDDDRPGGSSVRRRLAVVGLPLLALAIVVAVGWWFGTNVISAASSVDSAAPATTTAATPSAEAPAPTAEPTPAPLTVTGATVFDPFGDGESENGDEVPLSFDGDPATAWSTLNYRGSAEFGNLKPGVGVVYDLGAEQALAGVTVQTSTPGATVEVRTGDAPEGDLDDFAVAAQGELTGTDTLSFAAPVTTRYLLVWVTGLVDADAGFSADLAEVTPVAAT